MMLADHAVNRSGTVFECAEKINALWIVSFTG